MILYDHPGVAPWAARALAIEDFGPCRTIAALRGSSIVAAAVFNRYAPPDIMIHFVATHPRWATPGYVRAVLRYPFRQLGCRRITALTEATNQRARAFLCRLGFREEGHHPDAFMTGDGVSYGLLARDAARWLAEDGHGQIIGTRAA